MKVKDHFFTDTALESEQEMLDNDPGYQEFLDKMEKDNAINRNKRAIRGSIEGSSGDDWGQEGFGEPVL